MKTHTAQPDLEFVAPLDSPMAGQLVGVELLLALALAKVVQMRPKLLPVLLRMQESTR